METTQQYHIGDMVFAAEDIFNDGGMPGIDDEEGLIAPAGMRGVIVHYGVAEMDESKEIYLEQFENGPEAAGGPGSVWTIGLIDPPDAFESSRP